MANATVSRLGLVNNSGTDFEALFLKVFSGEVLTAFARNNIFNEQLHSVRTITSGKSAQFPVTGAATAAYHTPGNPLVGANQILANEKIISIVAKDLFDQVLDDLFPEMKSKKFKIKKDKVDEIVDNINNIVFLFK